MKNRVNCWKLSTMEANHSVAGNGGRDGLRIVSGETISSQAFGKPEEGSTSRESILNPSGHGQIPTSARIPAVGYMMCSGQCGDALKCG
jgi:hypothetical protein